MSTATAIHLIPPSQARRKARQRLRLARALLTGPIRHEPLIQSPSLALYWALKAHNADPKSAQAELAHQAVLAELRERYPDQETDCGLSGLGAETLRDIFAGAAARLGQS
jgi:hypothetical protein